LQTLDDDLFKSRTGRRPFKSSSPAESPICVGTEIGHRANTAIAPRNVLNNGVANRTFVYDKRMLSEQSNKGIILNFEEEGRMLSEQSNKGIPQFRRGERMLFEQSNKDNPRAFVARDGCFTSKATKRYMKSKRVNCIDRFDCVPLQSAITSSI